jgi:LacI family transcriptional regulator
MTQKATLADVAQLAQVSTATVSRVLSNPSLVRHDTLRKVREAIAKLSYVPDGAARALASRRTHTVGLVVPTLDHAIFSQFAQTLQATFAESGYQLLITSHEYKPALEVSGARALLERGVDGIVLVGLDRGRALNDLLAQHPIPVLATWSLDTRNHIPCVGFDNYEASRRVARHLLELGHRRFGVICGFMEYNDRARARVEGVRDALRESGIPLPAANVVEQPFTYAGGRAGLRVLGGRSPRPTAVICGNDLLAIGALLECRTLGLSVPADISIVGFDNQELASHMVPGLTTVNVPAGQLGRLSAQAMLKLLDGEKLAKPIELDVELVERGSTGPAPENLHMRATQSNQ